MKRFFPCLIGLPATILPAGPVAATCVENGMEEPLCFTVVSRTDATRIEATRAPGAPSAMFTVFASGTSVEGCPRLAGPAGRDRLLHVLPPGSGRGASHGE